MSEIYQVCRDFGVQRGRDLTETQRSSLNDLSDIAKILRMLEVMRGAAAEVGEIGRTLSPRALQIYSGVRVDEDSATQKIIKTLEKTIEEIDDLPRRDREALQPDREKFEQMLSIMRRAAEQVVTIGRALSQKGLGIYLQASREVVEGSSTVKIIKTLELTATRMVQGLDIETRNGIGVSVGAEIPSFALVERFITETCTPREAEVALAPVVEEESVVHPPVLSERREVLPAQEDVVPDLQPLPQREKPKLFDFGLFLGGGYMHRLDADALDVMPREGNGALGIPGASGRFNLSDDMALQLDYKFRVAYDFFGENELFSNYETADISFAMKDTKFEVLASLGYLRDRTDYPTILNPDIYAGTQNLQFSYRILPWLSFNAQERVVSGVYQEDPRDEERFYIRTSIDPSLTFTVAQSPKVPITIGGAFEYENSSAGIMGGGILGIGVEEAGHRFDLLTRDIFGSGLIDSTVGARYSYREYITALANYSFEDYADITRHNFSFKLGSTIHLGKGFFIEPYAEAMYGETERHSGAGFGGGLFIRYGDVFPAQPNPLAPYSIAPFREDF